MKAVFSLLLIHWQENHNTCTSQQITCCSIASSRLPSAAQGSGQAAEVHVLCAVSAVVDLPEPCRVCGSIAGLAVIHLAVATLP